MKTIVENATALSKYMLDDGEVVVFTEQNIVVGNPPKFAIGDLNSNNAIMYENVTAPEDWFGNKYTFTGSEWVINSNWVDPRLRDITP
jgi:hypothetical protein